MSKDKFDKLNLKDKDFFKDINPYLDGIYDNCQLGSVPKIPSTLPGYVYPRFPDTPPPKPPLESSKYLFLYSRTTPVTVGPSGIISIIGLNWSYINTNSGILPNPIIMSPITEYGDAVNKIGMDAFYESNIGRDIIIPEPINDLSGRWLFYKSGLTGVEFNDNISGSIGLNAFQDNKLGIVNLPRNVTNLERSCFENAGITKLNIPIDSKLIKIGPDAFEENYIKTLTLPNSLRSIGSYAFQLNYIETLSLNNGLIDIESGAFKGSKIKSLIIPDSLITLGASSFSNNKIKNLTLGKNLTLIYNYCFAYNEIERVKIPSGVSIFVGFSYNLLKYLYIPSTITSVSELEGNRLLTHIDLEDGVKIITSEFRYCTSLQHIRVPNSIEAWRDSIRNDSNFTINIYANLLPGDVSNELGTQFTLRGTKFTSGFKLRPLSEFPRDQSEVY